MAKVSFTKLGLSKNQDIKTITYNGQEIEVKQYLPVNEKLALISNVINNAQDHNNFMNPVKTEVFTVLEIIYAYTNIHFTDKQKEDPTKLYDLIIGNNFEEIVFNNIPSSELKSIMEGAVKASRAYYKYKNSVYGILEAVSEDYSDLDLDATRIEEKIANPENLKLLKAIQNDLG